LVPLAVIPAIPLAVIPAVPLHLLLVTFIFPLLLTLGAVAILVSPLSLSRLLIFDGPCIDALRLLPNEWLLSSG
jgi:hypothetical protein